VWALEAGDRGDGDAIVTRVAMLPICVATADCTPVVLESDDAVGIAHAGWRGAAGGVVGALRDAMEAAGMPARRAAIGPGIGPCCFEVRPEVEERFAGFEARTAWGTPSVDLAAAVREQAAGLETWEAGICTRCDDRFFSYRRDGTEDRQVTVAWLPSD
jgi:copper oxidase (laccase) domain-containing protein